MGVYLNVGETHPKKLDTLESTNESRARQSVRGISLVPGKHLFFELERMAFAHRYLPSRRSSTLLEATMKRVIWLLVCFTSCRDMRARRVGPARLAGPRRTLPRECCQA